MFSDAPPDWIPARPAFSAPQLPPALPSSVKLVCDWLSDCVCASESVESKKTVLQDLKLSLKRSAHRSLTLHINRAPHRNVCLGCVSLSLAASFLRPSVTPYCSVPDSAFLFSHLVPLYACTATFRFLVCTFQHFKKLNMSLPVASDNWISIPQLCRSERCRKFAKRLTQALVWSLRRPRIQIQFLHQRNWSRALWHEYWPSILEFLLTSSNIYFRCPIWREKIHFTVVMLHTHTHTFFRLRFCLGLPGLVNVPPAPNYSWKWIRFKGQI